MKSVILRLYFDVSNSSDLCYDNKKHTSQIHALEHSQLVVSFAPLSDCMHFIMSVYHQLSDEGRKRVLDKVLASSPLVVHMLLHT